MTIKAIIVVNNYGQPRLTRFYDEVAYNKQAEVIRDCFQAVSKRQDSVCNFLEGDTVWGSDVRLIYRHYATLYFIFAVDTSESELGILDLIQVFVESLDKCFENVCELDLIFHVDRVNQVLEEIVMAGMVLETSLKEIVRNVNGVTKHVRATKTVAAQRTAIVNKSAPKR